MAERPVSSRRSLEVEFFRMLNRVVEPIVRRGFGSPRLAPSGFIVLETVGRNSGELRRSPLAATRIGRHMIVATFRGDRSQWVRNLAAQPSARYWSRGVPHDTDAFVIREGSRVPAALPPPLRRVARFLVPYTRAGWAFAVLSPRRSARRKRPRRPRRSDARRELRPRRAADGQAGGDDRVLPSARLRGTRCRQVARCGSSVLLDSLRQPEDQCPRARDVAARGVHAARTLAKPGCGDLCFVWEGGTQRLHETLAAARAEIIAGPVALPGARGKGVSVYVRDPDANLLEFIIYE